MYNIANDKTPYYLKSVTPDISHVYNTRVKNIPQNHCHNKSLQFTGTSLWYNLPTQVKYLKKQ